MLNALCESEGIRNTIVGAALAAIPFTLPVNLAPAAGPAHGNYLSLDPPLTRSTQSPRTGRLNLRGDRQGRGRNRLCGIVSWERL